jgi:hypothetical protein
LVLPGPGCGRSFRINLQNASKQRAARLSCRTRSRFGECGSDAAGRPRARRKTEFDREDVERRIKSGCFAIKGRFRLATVIHIAT